MFKALLKTLPTLTGNFKLACKVDHIDKKYMEDGSEVFETNIQQASLQPLQNKLFNRDIQLSLLNDKYEHDIKKFYNKYLNTFYNENYSYSKNDFKYYDETTNSDYSSRNKNYEFGCKRISYFNTGYQYEFFCPIYIDNYEDLPKYLDIKININNYKHKTIRINLANDNSKNYLFRYLDLYIRKIDNKIIFFNNDTKQATYFGIDAKNGGFVAIKDNNVKSLYEYQVPINEFNKTINNGFVRNELVMKQIIPLAFQFNIFDLFTEQEKKIFLFTRVNNISANFSNGLNLPLYDINTNHDELFSYKYKYNSQSNYLIREKDTSINILNRPNKYSLKEKYLREYQYDKITPMYNHWVLAPNDEYDYYINLNINYTLDDQYGEFPNINNLRSVYLNLDSDKNINILESIGNDDYMYNLKNYINNWYTLYKESLTNEDDFISFLSNKNIWSNPINNYAYYKGILYNLNNINNDENLYDIDYFGVFVKPNFNILGKNDIFDEVDILIDKYSKNKNCVYDLDKNQFILGENNIKKNENINIKTNVKIKNSEYKFEEKTQYKPFNLNKKIYYNVEELPEDISINENDKIEGYIKLDRIYNVNNISVLNNYDNVWYQYSYDKDKKQLNSSPININSNAEFFIKTKLVAEENIERQINDKTKYIYVYQENNNGYFEKSKENEDEEHKIYYIKENNSDEENNSTEDIVCIQIINEEQLNYVKDKYVKDNQIYIYHSIPTYTILNDNLEKNIIKVDIKDHPKPIDGKNIKNFTFYSKGLFKYTDENLYNLYYPINRENLSIVEVNSTIREKILSNNPYYIVYKGKYNQYFEKYNELEETNESEETTNNQNIVIYYPLYDSPYISDEEANYQKNIMENYVYEKEKDIFVYNEKLNQYQNYISVNLEEIFNELSDKIYDEISLIEKFDDNHKSNIVRILFKIFELLNKDNKELSSYTGLKNIFDQNINESLEKNNFKNSDGKDINESINNLLSKFDYIFDTNFNVYDLIDKQYYNVVGDQNDPIINEYDEYEYYYYKNGNIKKNIIENIFINLIFGIKIKDIRKFNYNYILDKDIPYILNGEQYNIKLSTIINNLVLFDLYQENSGQYYLMDCLEKSDDENISDKILEYGEIRNGNYIKDYKENIFILLNYLYSIDHDYIISLIKHYDIDLYEEFESQKPLTIDFDESLIEKYKINIYNDIIYTCINPTNNKKYAFIFYQPTIDNTIMTFNINNGILFDIIDETKLSDDKNYDIFFYYFNKITPYLKTPLFSNFINIINYNNIIIKLTRIQQNLNLYSDFISDNNIINMEKIDVYNMFDKDKSNYYVNCGEHYIKKGSNSKISLYRYTNFIKPAFIDSDDISLYNIKYKSYNKKMGENNIYLSYNVDINNYPGVKIFDDPEISAYDNENMVYELEYKHFNSNKYFILPETIEIKLNKRFTYDEILENEKQENVLKVFKKYINRYQKIKLSENEILFLFNKYDLKFYSNPIYLKFNKEEKLYDLKYMFTLL